MRIIEKNCIWVPYPRFMITDFWGHFRVSQWWKQSLFFLCLFSFLSRRNNWDTNENIIVISSPMYRSFNCKSVDLAVPVRRVEATLSSLKIEVWQSDLGVKACLSYLLCPDWQLFPDLREKVCLTCTSNCTEISPHLSLSFSLSLLWFLSPQKSCVTCMNNEDWLQPHSCLS